MKKYVICFTMALLFSAFEAFSQGTSVTVFSANGEKFILEVNSSKENSKPESRVAASGVGGPMVKIKVYLEEPGLAPVSKSVMNKPNGDFYYVLEKDAKGKYVLTSSSYEKSQEAVKGTATAKEEPAPAAAEKKESKATEKEAEKTETKGTSTEKKAGKCETPISMPDFYSSREAISNAPFDPPKFGQAKKLSTSKCLTSEMVKEMMYIFSSEKTKLDYAKFAYDYVYDPTGYDVVNDALRQKSVDELNKYIESKK